MPCQRPGVGDVIPSKATSVLNDFHNRSDYVGRAGPRCSAAAIRAVSPGKRASPEAVVQAQSACASTRCTLSEAGVPGLDVDSWLGIFAPAKTPPEVLARLRRDIRASLPDLEGALREERRRSVGSAGRQARCLRRVRTRELDQTDPRGRASSWTDEERIIATSRARSVPSRRRARAPCPRGSHRRRRRAAPSSA